MSPEQALIHYALPTVKSVAPITIGLVHATYKVVTDDGVFVLQKLHPALAAPGITADYAAVGARLRARGVVAQEVVHTHEGLLLVQDPDEHGRAWRLLTFIPGRVHETLSSVRMARLCGAAVANFHVALRNFRYSLQGQLKLHPYDTEKFFADFVRVVKKFRGSDLYTPVAVEVELLLRELPRVALPADLPRQTVHGDLKITNFVFDESCGAVRSLIDLDTCARFSVLLELGDALRSWCGRAEDDPKNKFNMRVYAAAVDGYIGAGGALSAREKKLLPRAVQLITLNLASRFLKDYFEDCYFGFDQRKYKTRRAANLARARGQIALWKDEVKKFQG